MRYVSFWRYFDAVDLGLAACDGLWFCFELLIRGFCMFAGVWPVHSMHFHFRLFAFLWFYVIWMLFVVIVAVRFGLWDGGKAAPVGVILLHLSMRLWYGLAGAYLVCGFCGEDWQDCFGLCADGDGAVGWVLRCWCWVMLGCFLCAWLACIL